MPDGNAMPDDLARLAKEKPHEHPRGRGPERRRRLRRAAILTTEAEIERWITALAPEALELQRPLPDDILRVVAQGERKDGLAA